VKPPWGEGAIVAKTGGASETAEAFNCTEALLYLTCVFAQGIRGKAPEGLFTLFLQDALRIKKVMGKARSAAGVFLRQGFATRPMAFLAATRREWG
jgi:hypothetical protein